jgi:hypothetical protein
MENIKPAEDGPKKITEQQILRKWRSLAKKVGTL